MKLCNGSAWPHIFLDLRQRVLASYDNDEGTREQIASRYCVSLGMVKKLLQQRRHTGCIKPRHHLAGRKPTILGAHRTAMRKELRRKPDLPLAELRDLVGLSCTLPCLALRARRHGPDI